jgi:LuxR family maltose regulon positive regulatory protein
MVEDVWEEWGATAPGGADVAWPAPVEREALLDLLLRAKEPVIAVVAPPGYGKSTLLAQWARRQGSRVAWVSCDQVDDDPRSLWSAVTAALGASAAADASPQDDPDGDAVVDPWTRIPGLTATPAAIVLDQLEALSNEESRRFVASFAGSMPPEWTLALASRDELPLREARMHVEHRLIEVGTHDLAMSLAEANRLLAAAGVEQPDARTRRLVAHTEGWPAALYLAALAIRSDVVPADGSFSGTDRLMSDYLRSEVLDRLSGSERDFLRRTSILERLHGPLCDAVAGGTTGARLLERLARRNLLVMPLDGRGEWCRCHHLLRDLLQAELRTDSPDLVPDLHARAAAWFEANGEPDRAIDHAYMAGNTADFARLVLAAMQSVWASGQIDTVLDWMERLGRQAPAPHAPAMIAHGALIFALLGRPGDAERWAAVAESHPSTATLPDGSTVEGTLAYLRANLCRHGPAVMRTDAVAALEGLGPASPYRATMVHTQGLSYLLDGDLENADASFAHASDPALSMETSPLASLVLAEQFQVAVERDEWAQAESLIKRSLEIVSRGPFDDYWTSALPFASAARAAAHRGDMSKARDHARNAARLRPLLTYALPVVSVQALVELARAYLALVDPAGARAVLQQARGILQQRPDLGTLATAALAVDERVSQITTATPVGASSLTAAELRLVPLLPTHLTYPELGASSRKEAVERIVELGLI